MSRIAVFPGSFDPVTKGHESIALKAEPLFDKIIVGVGNNTAKKHMFSLDQRIKYLNDIFKDHPKIVVDYYDELTVDYCKRVGAGFIIRGVRTSADFEFERGIAQVNRTLNPEIDTVLILAHPETSYITSSVVREILKYNGDVSGFIPDKVKLV